MNQSSHSSDDRFLNVLLIILVLAAVVGGGGFYLYRKNLMEAAVQQARQADLEAEKLKELHQRAWKEAEKQRARDDAEGGSTF